MTKIKPGAVVTGTVTSIQSGRCINVSLTKKQKGSVFVMDISDDDLFNPTDLYEEGQEVQCYVMEPIPSTKHTWRLSLKSSRIEGTGEPTETEIRSIGDLIKGSIIKGFVKHLSDMNIVVWVGYNIWGHISRRTVEVEDDDVLDEVFFPGKMISVRVTKPLPEKGTAKLKLDDAFDMRVTTQKQKKAALKEEEKTKPLTNGFHAAPAKVVEPKKISHSLTVNEAFSWDTTFKLPKRKNEDVEEDEEEEDDSGTQVSKRKKSRFRSVTEQLQEEKRLFETENQLMQTDRTPQSAAEFDRLLMQSPDSSMVWMAYMAFHLETAEIDKARGVAERALTTISFREEREKLNMWVAYLNLENLYGTSEQLKAVIDRALMYNDHKKVYQQLAKIYLKSEKIQAAEEVHNTVLKKYKSEADVWVDFGLFYYNTQQAESARSLMQRSFKSLDKKIHTDVILKFAQMEFKYGDLEKGKTMMEGLLSSFPKRTDLWAIYVDLLVKMQDIDSARQILDRAIHLELNIKKMKFMFKKYLSFEEKHGNELTVKAVKEKAMEFIEAKTS